MRSRSAYIRWSDLTDRDFATSLTLCEQERFEQEAVLQNSSEWRKRWLEKQKTEPLPAPSYREPDREPDYHYSVADRPSTGVEAPIPAAAAPNAATVAVQATTAAAAFAPSAPAADSCSVNDSKATAAAAATSAQLAPLRTPDEGDGSVAAPAAPAATPAAAAPSNVDVGATLAAASSNDLELVEWLRAVQTRPELGTALRRLKGTTDPRAAADVAFVRALVYTCLASGGGGSGAALDALTEELWQGHEQLAQARRAADAVAVRCIQKHIRGHLGRKHCSAVAAIAASSPSAGRLPSAAARADHARCIVFGSLNMDLKAETVSRIADGASSTTGIFSASPGGKGANEAVALARLGVRTFLIGRVGKDEMGSVLLSRLDSIENLDTTCVARDTSVATGVAVQLVASNRDSSKEAVTTLSTGLSKVSVSCQGANNAVADAELDLVKKVLPPLPAPLGDQPTGGSGELPPLPPPPLAPPAPLLRASGSGGGGGAGCFMSSGVASTGAVGRFAAKAKRKKQTAQVEVVLLQLEVPLIASLEAARHARSRRCHVVLKASPLPALAVSAAQKLLGCGAVDTLVTPLVLLLPRLNSLP